jgi:hypothetical protein
MLDFLSSHDVVVVSEADERRGDTSCMMACAACTDLVKKTDRLQSAYERSLASLKRKHAKFKSSNKKEDLFQGKVLWFVIPSTMDHRL